MRRGTPVCGENGGDAAAAVAAAAAGIFCPVPKRVARIDSSCSRFREDILNVLTQVGGLEEEHSSSSFFCGSPPSRPANPMVDDSKFHEQEPGIHLRRIESTYSLSQSPSKTSGGCLIVKHDIKPTVRIEGLGCFDRQRRRGCGVSAVA